MNKRILEGLAFDAICIAVPTFIGYLLFGPDSFASDWKTWAIAIAFLQLNVIQERP